MLIVTVLALVFAPMATAHVLVKTAPKATLHFVRGNNTHQWRCKALHIPKVKCYKIIVAHDDWVIDTKSQHSAWQVQWHRRERANAKKWLKAHTASLGLLPNCHSGECIKTLIRQIWRADPEGAITVAWCESNWTTWNITGQYVGVFQMGISERAGYGHIGSGIYASSDGSTAIQAPAWEQIKAAYWYYLRSGWQPWQCSPNGGLNW